MEDCVINIRVRLVGTTFEVRGPERIDCDVLKWARRPFP